MGIFDAFGGAMGFGGMLPLSALAGRPPGLPNWATKPRLPAWATPPGLPASMTPPGMVPRGGTAGTPGVGDAVGALVGGQGGQLPGSVLGALGAGGPAAQIASGALGVYGPGRRYGSPGMPGGGVWGGGYGGYGAQPGAASAFTSDPALNPGAADATAYNAQINAANPGGADPGLPYYQGTTPGGGYLAGVGETLAPGRSVTQADADRFVAEARGLGATDEWMRDFLARNPNDYSRLSNVWHDEFTGGMGDSNDPRTAGQLAGGGLPGGGGAPGFTHPTYGVAVPDAGGYGNDTYNNPNFGAGGYGDHWNPIGAPGDPGNTAYLWNHPELWTQPWTGPRPDGGTGPITAAQRQGATGGLTPLSQLAQPRPYTPSAPRPYTP